MGFEDTDEAKGFEAEQMDLDSGSDMAMGTGRIKAQRKKGVKTEGHAFVKTSKRDRFGRRSDGEENGVGADMLNPDKPTKLSGGMSRRDREAMPVAKPLNSDSSKFGYLFSDGDGEDEDDFGSGASRLDGLSMTGDEDDADERFSRSSSAPVRSSRSFSRRSAPVEPPMPEPAPAPEPDFDLPPITDDADDILNAEPMSIEPKKGSRFSKRTDEKKGRFSKRESESEPAPAPLLSGKTIEDYDREADRISKAKEAAESVKENTPSESSYSDYGDSRSSDYGDSRSSDYSDSRSTDYGDTQVYYGQYGGYPPYPYSQPYQQSPYMQPYGGYPQYPPYPQYPQYPPMQYQQMPQFIPEGYVYQAGFVPIERSAGRPKSGKAHRASASRSAYRYDHAPEADAVPERREVHKVRAIAAHHEEPVNEPEPTVSEPAAAAPAVEEKSYPSQFDRIFSEVPAEPAVTEEKPAVTHSRFNSSRSRTAAPAAEETAVSEPPVSEPAAAPSRFSRRGASEDTAPRTDDAAPSAPASRFSRRSSASGAPADSAPAAAPVQETSAPSSGGRFKRRG